MPYIKDERRKELRHFASRTYALEMDPNGPVPPIAVVHEQTDNVGELNYLLTELCIAYFRIHGARYQQINDVIGALECCKQEFYRRVAAPYEDEKIKENGDVY
jgi:hypothetical protein